MTNGHWKALYFLTITAIFSFLAGKEYQRRELGPVDRVVVQSYLDSLLDDKRMRDDAFELWCVPANRVGFKYWLQVQAEEHEDSLTLKTIE